jgi:transposase
VHNLAVTRADPAHPHARRGVQAQDGARRWVVEACHSWLNHNRGLLTRLSKQDENHLALLQLASGLIALKKARAATLAGVSL